MRTIHVAYGKMFISSRLIWLTHTTFYNKSEVADYVFNVYGDLIHDNNDKKDVLRIIRSMRRLYSINRYIYK